MVERKKQMLKSKQKVLFIWYQNSAAELLPSVGSDADGCGDSLHSLLLPSQHRMGESVLLYLSGHWLNIALAFRDIICYMKTI